MKGLKWWDGLSSKNSKFWLLRMLEQKVVKGDSSEVQGRVLCFKGSFDWFEAISADSIPQIVKNVLKMGSFGKTPGVNGLKEVWLWYKYIIYPVQNY